MKKKNNDTKHKNDMTYLARKHKASRDGGKLIFRTKKRQATQQPTMSPWPEPETMEELAALIKKEDNVHYRAGVRDGPVFSQAWRHSVCDW